MRLKVISFLLCVLLLSIPTSSRKGHVKEVIHQKEDALTPLDSLIADGSDNMSTFGLELLQSLHMLNLKCRINESTAELKHHRNMDKLIKYYHSLEKLVSLQNFEEFSNENRRDIESNFHNTMRQTEKARAMELEKIRRLCKSKKQDMLMRKFLSLSDHAKKLIPQDPAHYHDLISKISLFKTKMMASVQACTRRTVSILNCYVDEMQTLMNYTDHFLDSVHVVFVTYYGDDEDADSGSGVESSGEITPGPTPEIKATESETPTPKSDKTTPAREITLPPGFFGVGPVIINPKEVDENEMSNTDPSHETTKPLPLPVDSKVVDDTKSLPPKETSETQSSPTIVHHTIVLPSSFFSKQTTTSTSGKKQGKPTPPMLTTISTFTSPKEAVTPTSQETVSTSRSQSDSLKESPTSIDSSSSIEELETSEIPSWLDKDFEEATTETEVLPSDPTASLNQAPKPHKKPAPHSNSHAIVESLVFDDEEPTRDKESRDRHGHSHLKRYIFISLTLGIIITILAIIIVVTFSVIAYRRRGRTAAPIISEKEMLNVMKKTGYVNPTYKYYSQH